MPSSRLVEAVAPLVWAAGALLLSRVEAATSALPALLLLRGPLGLVLVAIVLGASIARLGRGRGGPVTASLAPVTLFALSALIFLSAGLWYATRLRVSGDEPHYLIMAQSLWRDRDLDLRNNFERADYLEYTPGPVTPHYGAPRRDGRPYPAHSPGLPLLLAPVYASGGRLACVAVLALIAAALTLQIHALAMHATGDSQAAFLAWVAASGPPLFFYAFHVYTEAPSALVLASALRLLLASPGPGVAAVAAVLASLLPWLHVKMIPAAAALGLTALFCLRARARLVFLLTLAVATVGYLAYLTIVFGSPSPLAVYGGVPADLGSSPIRAFLGLLLDRSFGLLPHAPVFLLALTGSVTWLRRQPREAALQLLVAAAVVAPLLGWRMWWGGQSPAGRFLVPLLPWLAVAVAAAVQRPERGLARWRIALAALSWALALFMAVRPGELLLLNRGDRPTRVWAALSGSGDAGRYLPSLVSSEPAEWRVALLWLAALALLLGLDAMAHRYDRVDRLFGGLGLPLALLLLLGVLVDVWARPPPLETRSGGILSAEPGLTPGEAESQRIAGARTSCPAEVLAGVGS